MWSISIKIHQKRDRKWLILIKNRLKLYRRINLVVGIRIGPKLTIEFGWLEIRNVSDSIFKPALLTLSLKIVVKVNVIFISPVNKANIFIPLSKANIYQCCEQI